MNVTQAALAAYVEGLQARFLACKARSGSGDAAARPLPPALPPPVLPEGVDVYGRILNTLDLTTKERIHDDPGMAFVWVFGPDCLPTLGSVSGVWALWEALGVPENRLVDHLFVKGTRPALMLLPLTRSSPRSAPGDDPLTPYDATWDGVGAIVTRTYPRVADAVLFHLDAFRRGGEAYYDELESSVPPGASPRFTPSDGRTWGFWACLSNEGLARGAYFGYDELSAALAAGGGHVEAWQARLFLYCQLRMTREFTGSGQTAARIDDKGNVTPGMREFLLPNASVAEVKAAGGVFIDLAPFVDVPRDVLDRSLTLPFAGRYMAAEIEG
ncbi:MAG TPA: hypothetical protein VE093_18510 [Polyangiaceae bacterium]|nr:hypothetical protein [Polyangiaceae bacterium]